MIDEPPHLARRQKRRERPQIGAGAAAEVDDPDFAAAGKMRRASVANLRIARAMIGRFAKVEPGGVEAAHLVRSLTNRIASSTISAVSRQRN